MEQAEPGPLSAYVPPRPPLSLLHSPNNLLLAQQDLQAKIAMLEVYKILGVLQTQGNRKIQDNILGTCNIPSPLPHSQQPRWQMAEMDEVLLKTPIEQQPSRHHRRRLLVTPPRLEG